MTVAVCVPFRPRNDHETRLWAWVEARWRALFPDWQVCVADSGHIPFNRSASRNLAAEQCPDASTLIFANADTTFSDPSDLVTAVDIVGSGGWTLPALYVETSSQFTAGTLALDPSGPIGDPLGSYDRQLSDSPAGPQVVSREAWESVGRWDEAFAHGWAYEDAALRDALDVLRVPHTKVGVTCHLWHERTRAETVHDPGVQQNRIRYFRHYRKATKQRTPDARRAMMLSVVMDNR